jgi:Caspase domain
MCLVYDRRHLGGPGVHVLLIGVSAYPHLEGGVGEPAPDTYGIGQLTVAASTAVELFGWLKSHADDLAVPLATCRLLVAPSAGEDAAPPGAGRPVLDQVRRAAVSWRQDAKSDERNIVLFYFAGHGVQRSRDDAIAMLEDFGDRSSGLALGKAISTKSVFDGMSIGKDFPQMAATQLYFIDACRIEPGQFHRFATMSPSRVFDEEASATDGRCAPIFHAAAPGTNAYGIPGDKTLFGKALLRCLNGGAGEEIERDDGSAIWQITPRSLEAALDECVKQLSEHYETEQVCLPGGNLLRLDTMIARLRAIPSVDLVVEVLPSAAHETTAIEILDENDLGRPLPMPLQPHPYTCEWPAGLYAFRWSAPTAAPQRSQLRPITPPIYRKRIPVA